MEKFKNRIKQNFSFIALSAFWLVALLNPVFKKYDYGAEYPLVLVFIVVLMAVFIAERNDKRENNFFEQLCLWAFIAMTVFSFIFSETKNMGFSEVLAFISGALLYFNYSNKKIPFMDMFIKTVVIGALLSVTIGFLSYFYQPEPRMFGTFFNILYPANRWPNGFASFLLIAWPLLFLFKDKKHGLGLMIAASLMISALFLTFSRGALIAFSGQVLLLGLYYLRPIGRDRFKDIGYAALTLLFAISLFSFSNYVRSLSTTDVIQVDQRIEFQNNEELTSKLERIDFWKGAIQLMNKNPWFGTGPSSFRYEYNGIQQTFLGSSDHPHNIFLKIGLENGLIALIAFACFLIALFMKVLLNFAKLAKEDQNKVFILSVAVLGILAHNLIDYNFNFLANLIPLFMFLAFIRSILVKNAEEKKPKLELIFVGILVVLCLYESAILCLIYGVGEKYTEYSLFPRQYYNTNAIRAIRADNLKEAERLVDMQLQLNPMDGKAYYLRGSIECKNGNFIQCKTDFLKAIELDPMNDLSYYRDYFVAGTSADDKQIVDQATKILEVYFDYVRKDIHSTAYTENVEAAYDLAGYLIPYLPSEKGGEFLIKRQIMMDYANSLRALKRF
jgi:O-antigen ligase